MLDVTSGAEEALFWLGKSGIRTEESRVVLPDAAFELDLLDADERVFWAADPEVPGAYFTNNEALFEDDEEVLLAGADDIEAGNRVTIPTLLFESQEGAGEETVPVFEPGTTAHFLTNPDLMNAGVCMAAPESIVRELFEDRLDGQL